MQDAQEEAMTIDVDTSDALEMGPVEAGDYKVQVLKAEFRQADASSDKTWKALLLTLDIPDEITADIFSHMEFLPDRENQEGKRFERSKSGFNKFKQAFGFDPTESFTVHDLQGREAWAYLTIEENAEYGNRNKVQRWTPGPSASASGGVEY